MRLAVAMCSVCRQPISYALTYPHPPAFTVDHESGVGVVQTHKRMVAWTQAHGCLSMRHIAVHETPPLRHDSRVVDKDLGDLDSPTM